MPDRAAARKHGAYVASVHREAAKVLAHGEALRKSAPKRIAKAGRMLERAGVERVSSADDLDKHTHTVDRMLHEVAFYPPHDPRKESPQYKVSHDDLVRKQDLPCLACGVRQSTLKDPSQNPFGAVQMETHHHVIEWALANAVDPEKFNARVLPGLLRHNPSKYAAMRDGMTKQQILEWVDHDEDNLWVLCDVHHRHVFVGIHAITFPIWGPQDILDQELLDDLVKQAASGRKKTAARRSSRRKKASRSRPR